MERGQTFFVWRPLNLTLILIPTAGVCEFMTMITTSTLQGNVSHTVFMSGFSHWVTHGSFCWADVNLPPLDSNFDADVKRLPRVTKVKTASRGFYISDARSFFGLTSKIPPSGSILPPQGSMLNFTPTSNNYRVTQCENCFRRMYPAP